MDVTPLFDLSYGMYVIATYDDEKNVGCVVNTVTQLTSSPVTIMVSTNHKNYTTGAILRSGVFTVSILAETVPRETIGIFGFSSATDKDKFDHVKFKLLESELPVLTEGVTAYLECKVINTVDCHTHKIIIAEVTDAKKLSKDAPMTYDYYHKVVKGKAPKNAATYVADEADARSGSHYRCNVCGYVYPGNNSDFEALPADYRCPICNVPKSKFSLVPAEDDE